MSISFLWCENQTRSWPPVPDPTLELKMIRKPFSGRESVLWIRIRMFFGPPGSGSVSQGPLVRGTNPRIWIRTKMSQIHNTGGSVNGLNQLFLSFTQYCGSSAFLTPGSGIWDRFFPDPGSRIPNPYFWEVTQVSDNFLDKKLYNSLKIDPNFFL